MLFFIAAEKGRKSAERSPVSPSATVLWLGVEVATSQLLEFCPVLHSGVRLWGVSIPFL